MVISWKRAGVSDPATDVGYSHALSDPGLPEQVPNAEGRHDPAG
jgi:hypothetical protein